MGACGSNMSKEDREKAKEEQRRSKELDRAMRNMQQVESQVNKLLLLGAGESGKSTLFKQMLLIYGTGFSDEDKAAFTAVIHNNILTSLKTLIEQSGVLADQGFETRYADEIKDAVDSVVQTSPDHKLDGGLAETIRQVWSDPGIQQTFALRAKFQLPDSTDYFLDKVEEVASPEFSPSEQDVLRARVRTTGIVENDFKIDGNQFKILDVGGQRSERKKWIHCFSDVTAVIFVAAISEYDQVLFEDETVNRMDEALNLFEEICNSRFFETTSLILMLNKRDLFAQKLMTVPLTVGFPDYDGDGSYEDACAFVTELFEARKRDEKKVIYPHVTCATDTDAMKVVFNAVKDIVIRRSLEEGGLLA